MLSLRPIAALTAIAVLALTFAGCAHAPKASFPPDDTSPSPPRETEGIALDHWKLQLPINDPKEVQPPELEEKTRSGELKPYFYFTEGGELVFFARPLETTPNSRYSRTELREQLVPGSDDANWTLDDGGTMRGRLRLDEISHDDDGKPYRTIVAQIHGRLTDAQVEQIGAESHNAPPLIKVYWEKGRIRILTKRLKDQDASEEEILHRSAWEDDEPFVFSEEVGYDPFELELRALRGRIEVTLNRRETHVFETPSLIRWSFENYFKAGNYLQTTDEDAHATVIYYTLEVEHP